MLRLLLSRVPTPVPPADPASTAELLRLRWRSVAVRVLPGDAGLARCILEELCDDAAGLVHALDAASHDSAVAEACVVARVTLFGIERLLAGEPAVEAVREARRLLHGCLLTLHEDVAARVGAGAKDPERAARGVTGSAALVLAAGRADPADWEWTLHVAATELEHYARPSARFLSNAPLYEPLAIMHAEIESWSSSAASDRSEELGAFLAESLLAILEYG